MIESGKSLPGDFLVPTMDIKNPYYKPMLIGNYRFRDPNKIFEISMNHSFKEIQFQNMKATNLYF